MLLNPDSLHVLVTVATLAESASAANSGAAHRETADN